MFRSFSNIWNMPFADFLFKCENKAAPKVFHNLLQKSDHQKSYPYLFSLISTD